LVVINSLIFIIFAFSFTKPRTKRDWRSFSAFSAFIVALFAEMYGFPLTLFLLSGWLSSKFPEVNWLTHDAGHLLEMMFGWKVNPHFGPFHIASFVLIGWGFWLLSVAWPVLYRAQRDGRVAREGIYARIRHPQYVGFFLVMTGFLLQWPTLLTLAMYPILILVYARLSITEERDSLKRFGEAYARYMVSVPRFIPRRRRTVARAGSSGSPARMASGCSASCS